MAATAAATEAEEAEGERERGDRRGRVPRGKGNADRPESPERDVSRGGGSLVWAEAGWAAEPGATRRGPVSASEATTLPASLLGKRGSGADVEEERGLEEGVSPFADADGGDEDADEAGEDEDEDGADGGDEERLRVVRAPIMPAD